VHSGDNLSQPSRRIRNDGPTWGLRAFAQPGETLVLAGRTREDALRSTGSPLAREALLERKRHRDENAARLRRKKPTRRDEPEEGSAE
jgi:hypothetical protein